MGSWVRAAALPVAAPADESINWTVTEPVDQNFTEQPVARASRSASPPVLQMPDDRAGWKSAHQLELEAHAGEAPADVVEEAPVTMKRSVLIPRAAPRNIASGKHVLGWHPYWATTNDYYNYDYSNLTTIAYFSFEVNSTNGGYDSIHSWATTPVVEWAHSNGVKVVLTATLFGDAANHRLLTNATASSNLISNLLTVVGDRGGDGVCIDFEDVGSWTGATTNLTAFMSNLTTRFHAANPDYEVSIALPSVDWNADFAVSNFDRAGLDYAIIMGYDYYYSGSATPGPVAPLYSSVQWMGSTSSWCSVDYSMDYYLNKGITPSKLMLGVPYYGRRWAAASTNLGAASLGSAYSAALVYSSCESAAATYGKRWDSNGSVPYYVYTSSGTNYQCFYDDTNSLGGKYDLSESKGMGGIGIWNLTQGTGQTELWDLIEEKYGAAGGGAPADWVARDSGTTTAFYGIGAKAGSFAAVGAGGAIFTSADGGLAWTSRVSGTSSLLLNFTGGGGLWVAVGDTGTIVTSVGGATWTVRSTPTNAMLRGVTYGNGAWVAAGAGGTILRSTTGTSDWTQVTSGTTNNLQGVNYLNGLFIATGENSVLLTSADGLSWTSRTSNAGGWLLDSAYGNGTYVAVGIGARIVTSSDGTTWTRQTNSLPNSTDNLYRVTYGSGQFVAVGQAGAIWGSTNGVNWSAEDSGTTNFLRGVVFSNNLFVAAGYNGTVLTKGAGSPEVAITTAGATVSNEVSSATIEGTANGYVTGTLSWSNSLGGSGTLAAATNWSFPASLAVGTNIITVTGTNSAGASASDTVTFIRQEAAGGGGSGAAATAAAQPAGGLSDIVIYTSAGHGFIYSTNYAAWMTGRGLTNGVVEDIGNIDQLNYFADYCFKAGATVVPMRPLGNQTNEVVLDNTNAACVTFGGTWSNSTSTTYYGDAGATPYRYAYVNTTGTTAWAIYRPNLPAAGFYPVYTWVRSGSDRVKQLYRVYHSGGVTDVRVNHRRVGLGWVWLGTYYFEAGTNGSVNISNYAPGGYLATDVVIADAIRFGNGMGDIDRGGGVSGFARELEGSRYWVQAMMGQGMSSTLYDSASLNDSDDNVGAPCRMAVEMNREDDGGMWDRIYLGFHSNASSGAARGPMGLYDTRYGSPFSGFQQDYAQLLAKEVTNDLGYGALGVWFPDSFTNNTANLYGSLYGEIYGAISNEMNTTILEVAYHDNLYDTYLLRCPAARRVMAMAAYQGIVKHLTTNNPTVVSSVLLPDPPTHVSAANNGAGNVTLKWHAPVTNRAGGYAATGYIIYRSTNGYGFGNPVAVSGAGTLTATLTNMTAGQIYFFQVCATNLGGESLASRTVGVRVSPAGFAPHLVVNGFERNERRLTPTEYYANNIDGDVARVIQRRINSQDYVIQHGQAIAAAGRYFDSCDNEAVAAGDVDLSDYHAVYWDLGRESTADETFSSTEQAAVSNFLAGGKRLFVSGTELVWDLDYSGAAADKAFITNILKTAYGADDAATNWVAAKTNGIFAGMGSFAFDYPGTGTTYKAAYPDKLVAVAGSPASTAAIVYGSSTSGTNVAALVYSNAYRLVVMGFPFETIYSTSVRTDLMARTIAFFGDADADTPVIAITTTNQTLAAGTTSFEIAGTNNAAVTGNLTWTNVLTGGSGSLAASASWSVAVTLAAGTNEIRVSGMNYLLDQGATDTVTLVVSAAVGTPVVVITTPDQTVAAGTTSLAVAGTNNAAVVGTMRWTNNLTGSAGTLAAATSWSTNLALAIGTNVITVSGTNTAGTLASDSVQIIRPPDTPVVVITTPDQTVAAGTTSIAVAGTNNAAVVGTMRWTNNLTGSVGTLAAATSWSTNLALAIGTNVITVSGTNTAGTLASDSVQIIRPPDTPVVVITTPDQTVAAGTASIAVAGTNNAAVVGTMCWTNSLGGNGTFAAAAGWTTTVTLVEGTNLVTVSGTNTAGTWASDAVQIIRTAAGAGSTNIFEDDFEDGDLAGWTEDVAGNWTNSTSTPIAGNRSLKHNLSAVAATNGIYAQPVYDLLADTTTWRFQMKNGSWDPSADNRFHVFLAASESDFKSATVDGYAVGINVSGSDDLVKLWRVTDGAGTALISSALDWSTSTVCAVEVTRTAAGIWELKTATNGTFSSMDSAGLATDTTYTASTYFGLYYKCTSTRAGQVWLDDVRIHQGELVDNPDTDGDGMPDDYENTYFNGATNGVSAADDDSDGMSNYGEYVAGTNPKTNASVLAVTSLTPATNTTSLVFRWLSVTGRVYSIWMSTNAAGTYTQFIGNLSAHSPTNGYTNTAPTTAGTYFYGIGVHLAP